MAIKPVLAVLRGIASEDAWPEATLQRVALAMAAAGLPTSRELRLGFPPDEGRRREEVRGLSAELAAKLLVDPAELGVLIDAAVCSTMGISVSTCFSPVVRGEFRGTKRLLCGVLVDDEPTTSTTTTTPTSSSVLPASSSSGSSSGAACSILSPSYMPISALPHGRLSFGLSCAPPSTRIDLVKSGVAKSLSAGSCKRPRSGIGPAKTVSEREDLRFARAKKEVLDLLCRAGAHSAVYTEIFSEGPRDLMPGESTVLFGVLMARIQPKAILDYCKEVNLYMDWLSSIKRSLVDVGPLMLCSYLHMTLSRGKSIPTKVRCALVWFEGHAKVHMKASGIEVRDYVSGLTARDPLTNKIAKVARQAPHLPVDVVSKLERLVTTAHTLPLRVFAGVLCLCVHGVKRWSDVQHVSSISASADGLLVTTYKAKKRSYPVIWGALREGFDCDWASPFTAALAEAGLPMGDYLVPRPTVDLREFTGYPAAWADANRALHALLVIAGVEAEEAVKYSMHSARHVYPTCAFQLLFPPAAVTLMGHWAVQEGKMASQYDSQKTATEFAYKANVCANVQRGWRPVSEGCVPEAPRVPLGGSMLPNVSSSSGAPPEAKADGEWTLVPPAASLAEVPSEAKAEDEGQGPAGFPHHNAVVSDAHFADGLSPDGFVGEDARGAPLSEYKLPEHVVQVLNSRTATVHLSEGDGCWCNAWKCGSRESPASTAEFAVTSRRWSHLNKVAFCRNCHSIKTVLRMGGVLLEFGQPVEASSSSSSESSSDDSCESD